MIDKTFGFSIAAGAAGSNVMPSDFNPVPADGVLEIWGVTDGAITGLTGLPSVELKLGGATQQSPLSQSVIPIQEFNIANAGTGLKSLGITLLPAAPAAMLNPKVLSII